MKFDGTHVNVCLVNAHWAPYFLFTLVLNRDEIRANTYKHTYLLHHVYL